MARLDELLQREPAGPARDTLLRLSGQGAAQAAPQPTGASRRSPITVEELGPPADNPKQAVAQAQAAGVPHQTAVQAATEAETDTGFDWSTFLTAVGAGLTATGVGGIIGVPMLAYARSMRGQEAQESKAQVAQAMSAASQQLADDFDAAAGDPVKQQQALVRGFRTLSADPNIMATAPDFAQTMLDKALKIGTPASPEYQALSPGQTPGRVNPVTGQWEATGPAAPFAPQAPAVTITNKGETELSIQKARADADRIYVQIPAARRDLRSQMTNTGSMLQLLEAGTETGQWPDAIKRTIRDNFGIDVGLDPALETLSAQAGQQMLGEAQQLKGSFSDRDVALIQSLTASTNRGREANIAILKARQEVLKRLDQEADLEEAYFERNQSRSGFEAWLKDQNLGPLFSDDALSGITKPINAAAHQHGQLLNQLETAITAGRKEDVDRALVALGADRVKQLPKRVRDNARAILEGKPMNRSVTTGQVTPAPDAITVTTGKPTGSGATQAIKDLLGTLGVQ